MEKMRGLLFTPNAFPINKFECLTFVHEISKGVRHDK